MDLPSTKPYLIRAIHQWCTDNGFTPYLAVTVDARTRVPMEHVRDGQIVIRKMANLSITLDHRIVDGATAAHFMNELIRLLENPGLMLVEGV